MSEVLFRCQRGSVVAGLVAKDGRIVRCAPILRKTPAANGSNLTLGRPSREVIAHMRREGWAIEEVTTAARAAQDGR